MKIGLLKCDSVQDRFVHIAGDYDQMFTKLFTLYAPDVELIIYDVVNFQYPKNLNVCDAYITTGSANSVYDNDDWVLAFADFVIKMYGSNTKFIGICFGHQMMAHALGGRVEKVNKGWGVGVKKATIIADAPWMNPKLKSFSLLLSHQDQVVELPEHSKVLGTNEHCEVSMFTVGEHFLGIQAHPEFVPKYAKDLMVSRTEKIGQPTLDIALNSLDDELNRCEIVDWIINFVKN